MTIMRHEQEGETQGVRDVELANAERKNVRARTVLRALSHRASFPLFSRLVAAICFPAVRCPTLVFFRFFLSATTILHGDRAEQSEFVFLCLTDK
ncbi:hypothetical protein NDU88_001039 [Pleurodeles waltl]|uniref:Transmembrane protein n=1 Tax=Pleurodeles waltl TaxID=8319 RepID=A0AAV7SZB9_PLEWA|nr:hypothetical protein NDU88_001039 [Pleurodeles waltl]